MTPTIHAIETRWNGYRFRSRTEARWAVFLNRLLLKFEYEPEGYRLPGGVCYLPDFYFPHLDAFLEIKGSPEADISKVVVFREAIRPRKVFVAHGLPPLDAEPSIFMIDVAGETRPAQFKLCPCCMKFGIYPEFGLRDTCACIAGGFDSVIERLPWFVRCTVSGNPDVRTGLVMAYSASAARLRGEALADASQAARAARFEHGESPEVYK